MNLRVLVAIIPLLTLPPLARADNNPASGMYAPSLIQSDADRACNTSQTKITSRFYATADCEFTCTNGPLKHASSRELEWDPEKEPGMFKGDGALWATLTQRLSNKGKRTCLEAATEACQGLERVDSLTYLGMKSGAWSMPAQVLCGPGQLLSFSPYDNAVAPTLRRHSQTSTAGVQLIAELTSNGGTQKYAPMPEGCQKTISIKVCFGDCLCDAGELVECPNRGKSQQWAEVLGTRKPPATREITICADALVSELANYTMKNYSRDVLQYYCEDYAWRTIFARKPIGSTCSAYRGRVDCRALF